MRYKPMERPMDARVPRVRSRDTFEYFSFSDTFINASTIDDAFILILILCCVSIVDWLVGWLVG